MYRIYLSTVRDERWTASECFVALNHEYERLYTDEFDIFFSHRWASKAFLAHLYNLLVELGYRVWYDVLDMGYDLVSYKYWK